MRILKVITSFLVIVALVFTTAACAGSETSGNNSAVKFISGKLTAPGDTFEFKTADAESGAPVIAGVTKQASPGESVTVTGEGLSGDIKAYIYSQSEKGKGKTESCEIVSVDDNEIAVIIPKSYKYGVYGIYVEKNSKKSNKVLINAPDIWWIGLREIVAGETFDIYGENLTSANAQDKEKTNVYFKNDKGYVKSQAVYADPHKITVTVPECLESGKEYEVAVHNGHGGDGCFAYSDEKVIFKAKGKGSVNLSGGKTVDVTEYGAKPDSESDCSAAVEAAINAANDGDTIYFPEGTYIINKTVTLIPNLRIKGADANKTVLKMGADTKDSMFYIQSGPVEFTGLGFYDVKATGELKASFIRYKGDSQSSDTYNLYIHECRFEQGTSATAKSKIALIYLTGAAGVKIENNDFLSTTLMFASSCKKIKVSNNKIYGTFYVGPYYDQNTFLIWDSAEFDASDNYIASGDVLIDNLGILDKGDYTVGRSFALQGHGKDLYFGNNTVETAGLPDDNAGEQIMLENMSVLYDGMPQSAGKNTLNMPADFTVQLKKGDIVTVIDGKGLTQYRHIESFKGTTVTVDKNWDIIPDSTSRLTFERCFENIAIYKNSITGYKNFAKNPGATTGVQAYGGIHNMYISENTFKDMCTGMSITTHYQGDNTDPNKGTLTTNGIYQTIISNNKIQHCAEGIRFNLSGTPKATSTRVPPRMVFLMNIRNNDIATIVDYEIERRKDLGGFGITVGTRDKFYHDVDETLTWPGKWVWGSVIENNVFYKCKHQNIYLFKHQSGTILRNNTVEAGIDTVWTKTATAEDPIVADGK